MHILFSCVSHHQDGKYSFKSCIKFVAQSCLKLLTNEKIHVQIMMFACCLNMGFNLTILKMSPDLFDIKQKSIAVQTDHYVDIFVCKNVAHIVMML